VTRFAVAIAALTLIPFAARAQVPDTLPPGGLRTPGILRDTLRVRPLPPIVPSGVVAPPSAADVGAAWEAALRARFAARQTERWAAGVTGRRIELPARPLALEPEFALPPRAPMRYADLGMVVNARFEMRFDRLQNLRCTAADASRLDTSCRADFPPPRIEPQFDIRSGGVVGERIHINVDYDTEREFEASNNIQVYYQGLEDEMLRRVQVGNVTFQAPPSRFVTGGIPANNFGAAIEAQIGAVTLGGIFAQQKGNVVRGRTFTIGDRTLQPQERDVMDRDFEPLRFFAVVDPALLPAYPAVDILNFAESGLAATLRPREVRIYRRRTSTGRSGAEQNLGGINAIALRPDSPQRAGPFPWELLVEGRDYYLDPSGAWFALASRIDIDDYLAVSYVTAAGDTIGTFPGAATDAADTLRLIYEPRRGAEVPTFRYELRNVYRVGGVDDVVRESAGLRILVAESERPDSGAPTFLALLGLGQLSNANVFDQYNRMFPRLQDPGRGAPLRDFYIVYPHLAPFADSARLAPQFRNDSLYRTPTAQLRTEGPTPLYRMRLTYDASGGDDRRVLSLGGFQIREGSERISAGGVELRRGTDYTMNYEIGQVTFLNPDSLFRSPTNVQVQYEENPAFAIAPTSIYGLQARYDLGDHGSFGAIGLLQRQRTTFTRPSLGFEPSSNFVGGLMGNFRFEPNGLTRLLDGLPLVTTGARSTLTLDAEIATSRPSPNQLGVAYVETFEEEGGTFIPLAEDGWEFGSRPSSALGLAGLGITAFNDADASLMVWQNFWASGGQRVEFRARQIDPEIRLLGAAEAIEPVLWLTLHPDTVGGLYDSVNVGTDSARIRPRWFLPHSAGPRWRTLAEPLSSTGVDLSRVEFLEFWVYEDSARTARTNGVTLVFDFGTVYEDAVAFQPTGFRVTNGGRDTVFEGRRRAGEGRLDTERDTLTNAFNAGVDDVGIMGDVADSIRNLDVDTLVRNLPLCQSELRQRLVIYTLGQDLVRCTRGNGRPDGEDLNGDQHLDSLISGVGENHFRYVFDMADDRYFVRAGATTAGGATWRLYRIPFRADTLQVGVPDIRQVRSLRLTMVAPDNGQPERLLFVGLARVKLVGAPWVKRAGAPIAGLSGGTSQPHGEVIASVVSTENSDLGYEPPPGVFDAGATRGGQFNPGATQINERSLRLVGSDVRAGERAEAFLRFAEGDRNFLGYRQLRVWARGRGAGWVERHLAFYVKVAQDENNFYLYRQALDTASWEPEAVVDLNRWLALRAAVEQAYLRGEPASGAGACGGDTLAYVACDGPYMVHVRNPGVAPPNLSRVQELAVGFVRDSGPALDSAELWVDDIRLTQVVDDAGYAGAVSGRLAAADVADIDFAVTRRDRNFRQLGETPSYQTSSDFTAGATIRLEKFGLERLGLAMPVTMRFLRSSRDPFYLNRTDVEAAGLDGLRRPRSSSAAYALSLRRSRRGTEWWQKAFVDNVGVAASWSRGSSTSQLTAGEARTFAFRADYQAAVGPRSFSYVPGFVRDLLRGLPAFLRNTDMVRGLETGRLRWTPAAIALTSEFASATSSNTTFRAPIETPLDSLNRPVVLHAVDLRSRASLDLRPFAAAALGLALTSDRDLRDYGDSTLIGRIANAGRQELLGADVGFERTRQVTTRLSYNPSLVSWLRPRMIMTTGFNLSRDPNQQTPERETGDSAGAFRLPTTFANQRTTELGAVIDWSRPLRALFGDSSLARRVLDRVSQMDVSSRRDRRSQFTRTGFDPGFGFQLGLGGTGGFREQRGIPATAAVLNEERRVTSGLRLPFGIAVTGSYVALRGEQWYLRAEEQQAVFTRDTDWPNVTTRWLFTPRGGLASVLSSINVSFGVRRRASETIQPPLGEEDPGADGALRTTQETRSRPLSLTALWLRRVSTTFSASNEEVRSRRSGNLTVGDRGQRSADLSFSFRPPPEYLPLRSDVRTVLRYLSSHNGSCVQRAGTTDCVPIAESRRNEYTLLMDTDMPPNASAGLSLSRVVTEDVHANRKFAQLVFTATVRLTFQAGGVQ
jgi:hypothetical protein